MYEVVVLHVLLVLAYEDGRGIQYLLSMMRKCVMVKIEGAKEAKNNENRGKIYKFCQNMGVYEIGPRYMQYGSLALGAGCPWRMVHGISTAELARRQMQSRNTLQTSALMGL